jgi:ribosome-binding factor A
MTKPLTTKSASQRQLRVGEVLRHALAEILLSKTVQDADLVDEIVTIPEVRVSPDLRHATVFVATLGSSASEKASEALNRHQRYLRGELGRRVELRYVPELAFRGDHSVAASERIDAILRSPEVARDLK